MNAVLSTISLRRSHRAYTAQQLSQPQLDALIQAALDAPSAVNDQPWHFSVVQNPALLDEMDQVSRENMMKEAEASRSPRLADRKFHIFYHAPTVIFISCKTSNPMAGVDCGIAVENIALAAESLGLGSVILGLPRFAFQDERGKAFAKTLEFPDDHQFVIAIALGVPADEKAHHGVKPGKVTVIR